MCTAPVVAEEQGVTLAQFRRDQSVLYHEIRKQPLAEPLPVAESVDEVKQKLENQKNEAKKAMMQWYRTFVKEHNREPTKEERDKYVGAEYRQFRKVSAASPLADDRCAGWWLLIVGSLLWR